MNSRIPKQKFSRKNRNPINNEILTRLLLLVLAVFSLLMVILFFSPYDITATYLNHLASDGQLESFTPTVYKIVRIPTLVIFLVTLIFAIFAQINLQKALRVFNNCLGSLKKLVEDFFHGWLDLASSIRKFCTRNTCLILAGVTLLAFLMRILLIQRPMQHDEAYSAVVFAFEPLKNGLADYHFPNNHVFHTFLVHIAYKLFGPFEWAVRLPAFIASVLLAPFGYVLAKRWYQEKIALISAMFIAVFPALIHYAVNARGYSLMALFTLMLFILGDYVKHHSNPAAWFLIAITGALGFYTLPIMAYPLAIFYVWMGLIWLFNQFEKEYSKRSFLSYFFSAGILTLILGLGLYTPIFLNWGFESLFANPYVSAMDQSLYLQTANSRLTELWSVLNQGIPVFGFLLIIGYILSIFFPRKASRESIPLQILSILIISILVAIQRPNIFARTWVFYFPLLIIWATAGWIALSNQIGKITQKHRIIQTFLTSLFTVVIFVNGLSYIITEYPTSKKLTGDVEQATLFLGTQLNPDDIVVITATDDAAMWFYFEKYGFGGDYFLRDRPFKRAFIVVTRSEDQTVEQVIHERGPDLTFFNLETQEKIETINRLDLYRIEANHSLIDKYYGDK